MSNARKEVEIAVRVGNEPGALAHVLSAIAAVEINVFAYCSYTDRHDVIVLLVTDDAAGTKRALQAAGYSCRANSVVIAGGADRVGGAALLGARLSYAGIDILYSYASSAGTSHFCAVFKTSDDLRAIMVLDTPNTLHAA